VKVDGSTARLKWMGRGEAGRVGVAFVAHGFARSCSNVSGASESLVDAGFAVACVEESAAGGNPELARRLATLAAGADRSWLGSDARMIPEKYMVAGHSAGGHFALALGSALAKARPAAYLGAILWDPVGGEGFASEVDGASGRPVLWIASAPGACNRLGESVALLGRAGKGAVGPFVGVELGAESTHLDAEGSRAGWLAPMLCGEPRERHASALRRITGLWALKLSEGSVSAGEYAKLGEAAAGSNPRK
jgi:hypothetical protein